MVEEIKASSFKEEKWHSAQLFYLNLYFLLQQTFKARLENNLYGWYSGLDSIYQFIFFKIPEKEDIEFQKKFMKLRDLFSRLENLNLHSSLNNLNNGQSRKLQQEIPDILRDITKSIMVILDKSKMLFPNFEMIGGFDKLAKDWHLE